MGATPSAVTDIPSDVSYTQLKDIQPAPKRLAVIRREVTNSYFPFNYPNRQKADKSGRCLPQTSQICNRKSRHSNRPQAANLHNMKESSFIATCQEPARDMFPCADCTRTSGHINVRQENSLHTMRSSSAATYRSTSSAHLHPWRNYIV